MAFDESGRPVGAAVNNVCNKNEVSIDLEEELKEVEDSWSDSWFWSLGVTVGAKMDVFFGKVPKGGGVISDPKNYIADFVGFEAVYFARKFGKKSPKREGGVISNPKNVIANLRKLTYTYEKSIFWS